MELKRVDPNFLPNSAFDCPTCCQQSIQNVWSSYFSNNWANWAYYFAFHELRYPQAPNMKDEWMRVISKTRLRRFWESPGNTDSQGPLRAWHSHVNHRSVAWQSWSDVKIVFGSASLVGNCAVFNIGGNKYRLVTRILYPSQKVFILKVMTHAQYDEDKWKEDCGCYEPPVQKPKKRGK